MSATYENVLSDLKVRFGDKIWLTPKDLEPLLDKSEDQQTSSRFRKTFPLPVRPIGRSVGVAIYHLAEWLATDKVEGHTVKTEAEAETESDIEVKAKVKVKVEPTPRRQNKFKKPDYISQMLSFWQASVTFQYELIVEIELVARTAPNTEKPLFSPADLQEWRERLRTEEYQCAQIEKKILLDELDGIDFPEPIWIQI